MLGDEPVQRALKTLKGCDLQSALIVRALQRLFAFLEGVMP
jgi:hypothetical protein